MRVYHDDEIININVIGEYNARARNAASICASGLALNSENQYRTVKACNRKYSDM